MNEIKEKSTLKVNYGPIYCKGYGRLFHYLFFNPKLDNTARAVLVYISALLPSSGEMVAWPGVETIKKVTGAGIHQVQQALNLLEELGIIEISKVPWRKQDNKHSFEHNIYEIKMRPKKFRINPDVRYRDNNDIRDYGYKDLPLCPIVDSRTKTKEIIMWGLICLVTPANSQHCAIDEERAQNKIGLSANSFGKKTGQQYRALEVLKECGYIDFKYDQPKKGNSFHGSYSISILNNKDKKVARKSTTEETPEKEKVAQKSTTEETPGKEKVARKSTIEESLGKEKVVQKSTAEKSTAEKSTTIKGSKYKQKIIRINQSGHDRIIKVIEESPSFNANEKELLESVISAVYGGIGTLIVRNKEYEYKWLSSQLDSLVDSEIIQVFGIILVNSAKHSVLKNRTSYLIACLAGELENKKVSRVNLRSNRNTDYNALAMQELMEKIQN